MIIVYVLWSCWGLVVCCQHEMFVKGWEEGMRRCGEVVVGLVYVCEGR